jgi:hypothetical protein
MKYYVESEFGSALTDSPEAYIKKEDNGWKFRMVYGGTHETYLKTGKNQ